MTDFDDFQEGKIAIFKRGTCYISQKIQNAIKKKAIGAIVYNNEEAITTLLNAGVGATIPVHLIKQSTGENLIKEPNVIINMFTNGVIEKIDTFNIIAETYDGDKENIVTVGAHTDSVTLGPGINDNGSGTATILEIANQFSKQKIIVKNKIRFCWWAAEGIKKNKTKSWGY
jgi:aminopeptidase Y